MGFIEDLEKFEKLSDEDLDKFITFINNNPIIAISDLTRLEKWSTENNISPEDARAYYAVLGYIARYIIDETEIKKGCNGFENKVLPILAGHSKVIPIWERIKQFFCKLDNFLIAIKKNKLRSVNNGIDEFKLICDIRPVYNLGRNEVVDYIYPIVLRIESDVSSEPICFDLSEDDLDKILVEVNRAKTKIEILKKKKLEWT